MLRIMSVDGSRTSVFTFQSAVHSMHVLNCLDEQRQKDILCDVTVEVESRSFRAHCSVLACCSDYFYTRLINHPGWNLVLTLPDEVTVEGFVPLLHFAYTAKLHFTKDNILEIHRCAELLGFHNLDKACFEFLIPKLNDGSRTFEEVKGKSENSSKNRHDKSPAADGDCRNTDEACTDNIEAGVQQNSGTEMVHNESSLSSTECSPEEWPSVSSDKDLPLDLPSVSFHAAADHSQTELCLQSCGPQLVASSDVAPSEVCPFLSMPCSSESENGHPSTAGCDGGILEMEEVFQNGLKIDETDVNSASKDLNMSNISEGQFDQATERAANTSQLCPLSSTETSEVLDSIASVGNTKSLDTHSIQTFDTPEQIFSNPTPRDGSTERSTVEREVAEHLAKGFWPGMGSSLTEPLEPLDQPTAGNGSDFYWLKHLDLGAAPDECPFLRDLSSKEAQPSADAGSSNEEDRETSFVSSINSGENSECDPEPDCEICNEEASEVDLPFPVEQISSMSRQAFLQVQKRQHLTPEQVEYVQVVRRRSKNRVAAQRSRKKKLECIYRLEGDIKRLRTQKERLRQEQNELKKIMEETQQSLSCLSDGVCPKESLVPELEQGLSRYVSSDWPSSVLLTPTASPNLTTLDRDSLNNSCLKTWSIPQPHSDSFSGSEADENINNSNDDISNLDVTLLKLNNSL